MKEKMKKTHNPNPQSQEPNPPAENELKAETSAVSTPEEPVEELKTTIEKLQTELSEAQAKANEYLDGWQRSRAEFVNYKKRLERDQATTSQVATGNVVKHFLDVVDDLDRALKNRPQSEEDVRWAEGIDLIYRKLLSSLEAEGVQVYQADGQDFDPLLHEAISHEDHPDLKSGQVIATVQQGYILGERVLRPARVRVAR